VIGARGLLAYEGGATATLLGAALIPVMLSAAIAVDYSRANSAKADAQSAVDAAALAALNAPNRGQGRKDAIRIVEQSVHQARGSVEALKPKVDWIDSSTVEVSAELRVRSTMGALFATESPVGVTARATKAFTRQQKITVRPVSNCPFTNDLMALSIEETNGGRPVKTHQVYSNATPMPGPITVELGEGSTYRFAVATQQGNRKGTVNNPPTVKAYADQKPAYFEQVGTACDKTAKVVQGWETPFDPAPYANFLRIRYEYTCESSETSGMARLVR